jgi:bacillithiol system protein YtxJ|tara:strand:- start:2372 stop:2803 length:432 start_codon:yes stop_codon:yes gene_type:complete
VEQQKNVLHTRMWKFLNNKVNSSLSADEIKFEHPESLQEISGFLALKTPVFFYKHSPRCSVSLFVMKRLNSVKINSNETWVYIDVISQRALSLALAEEIEVRHESPQLIFWYNGQLVAHASHENVNKDIVDKWRKDHRLTEQV